MIEGTGTRLDQAIIKVEVSSRWRYRGHRAKYGLEEVGKFKDLTRADALALMGPAEDRRPYVLEPRYIDEIEGEMP